MDDFAAMLHKMVQARHDQPVVGNQWEMMAVVDIVVLQKLEGYQRQ